MVKILFADSLPKSSIDAVKALGHTVDSEPALDEEALAVEIAGYDVLVVRSTRVSRETIEASDRLFLVIRAGAGTNTIDTAAAAARGIYVTNVPGRNAIAVAELTMGLILANDRRIPDNVADLRNGVWNKKKYQKARGVHGQTLGIIGLGEIGFAVAERAAGFGINVIAVGKPGRSAASVARAARAGIRFVADEATLAAQSDVVSVHVPFGDATRHLIGAAFLSHMKPGALIVNTARGGVVDEAALRVAMDERGIRAALDVYEREPAVGSGPFDDDIGAHPNVYGTHHIGASTEQAQEAVAAGVVEIIAALDGGLVLNCVNLEPAAVGKATLIVRHYDRVGVLASVLDQLRQANINVQDMTNRIFTGGMAAVATIHVADEVATDLVSALRSLEHVIHVELKVKP